MRKDFLGRGWRFPFGVDAASGGVALSEYEENIQQSISLILSTKPGERQMLPAFGCRMHEAMFRPHNRSVASAVKGHVLKALRRWEPRIEVTDVEALPDAKGTVRILVNYKIKSTLREQQHAIWLQG